MNPCTGTCGLQAVCHVVYHNPICSCGPTYTGDPFVQCIKEGEALKQNIGECLMAYILCRSENTSASTGEPVHSVALRSQCGLSRR